MLTLYVFMVRDCNSGCLEIAPRVYKGERVLVKRREDIGENNMTLI
jgi:hypothetical protein